MKADLLVRDEKLIEYITEMLKNLIPDDSKWKEYDPNPVLIQLTLRKKKVPLKINDIDKAIGNLKRYISQNKKNFEIVDGEAIVFKKDLAKGIGISRPTLDKWIAAGFIKDGKTSYLNMDVYKINLVLKQLQAYKP